MKAREVKGFGLGKAVRAAVSLTIAAQLATGTGEVQANRLVIPPTAALPSAALEQPSSDKEASADSLANRATRRGTNLDRPNHSLPRSHRWHHQTHRHHAPSLRAVWDR